MCVLDEFLHLVSAFSEQIADAMVHTSVMRRSQSQISLLPYSNVLDEDVL